MKSNFFKLFENSLKRAIELPPGGMKTEKEVFYLNDFYDLLYEKENTVQYSGTNPPEYFEREKYYTMGPGIDFPMIMSYKDTENPNFSSYYYFLNGHNDVVYFADANFTEEKIEDYEYNPWGVLLTQANKNKLLYRSKYHDFEIGLFLNGAIFYNPKIARVCYKGKTTDYNQIKRLSISFIQLKDTDDGVNYFEGYWSCFDVEYSLDCFEDDNDDDGGGGGVGDGEDDPECKNPTLYTECSQVCGSLASCKSCCSDVYSLCKSACKLEPLWFRAICYIACGWELGSCKIDCGINFD